MKKYISLLIITSLLFSGCGIDGNGEKDKKIEELEKQINSISFEKQKECLSYKGKIESAIQDTLDKRVLQRSDYTHEEYLADIFYSPIKNTCLYSTNVVEKFNDGRICLSYTIYDFFSLNQDGIGMYLELKKNPDGIVAFTDECDITETEAVYRKAIAELKGE